MPLELGGYPIDDKFVRARFDFNQEIYFSGRALDEDGRVICDTLSKMKGKILEVKIDHHEGIYEFYELKIEPCEEIRKDCYIYRFSGRLKPVY